MSRFSIEKDNEYNKTLNENISDENMQKNILYKLLKKFYQKVLMNQMNIILVKKKILDNI